MRFTRYFAVICAFTVALTTAAAPEDGSRRELRREKPPIVKRIVRSILLLIQPLNDFPSPPHP
jgi:hypothetical protein